MAPVFPHYTLLRITDVPGWSPGSHILVNTSFSVSGACAELACEHRLTWSVESQLKRFKTVKTPYNFWGERKLDNERDLGFVRERKGAS